MQTNLLMVSQKLNSYAGKVYILGTASFFNDYVYNMWLYFVKLTIYAHFIIREILI